MMAGACTGSGISNAPTPHPSNVAPRARAVVATVARYRLPAPIAREAVMGRGPVVTVAGGLLPGNGSTAAAYAIDLRSGHVTNRPNLQVPVHDTAGAAFGNRMLVIGGGNAFEQDVVQARTGGAWSTIGHLPRARSDLSAVVVGKRAVVLGGFSGQNPAEADILASDSGRTWATIGRLPVPVRYAATTAMGHKIWLFGGEQSGQMKTAIQEVDSTSGRARMVGLMPSPLGHASAMVLGRRILSVGGRRDGNTIVDTMWWFDPAKHKLAPAGHLPMPLADAAAVTYRNRGYVIGGESPRNVDTVILVAPR